MLYSCFNDRLRVYEVFEDDRGHPVNADLPVPSFPSSAGNVGVPASEAGRPLPAGTKRVGTSWLPRGLIVRCKNQAVRGLGDASAGGGGWQGLAVVGLVGFGMWWVWRNG